MSSEDKSSPTEVVRVDDKDWFLCNLIGLADEGFSVGLVLNVNGILVSGHLCSGMEYFDTFGMQLGKGVYHDDDDAAKSIAESYHNLGKTIYNDDLDRTILPTYIHMKNAKFYSISGKSIPSNGADGVLWRGKISNVNGFSLGVLSPDKS